MSEPATRGADPPYPSCQNEENSEYQGRNQSNGFSLTLRPMLMGHRGMPVSFAHLTILITGPSVTSSRIHRTFTHLDNILGIERVHSTTTRKGVDVLEVVRAGGIGSERASQRSAARRTRGRAAGHRSFLCGQCETK